MRHVIALLTLAGAASIPLVPAAQTPMPKATNAIKNTTSGIHNAAKAQSHAQAKSKSGSNRVGVGGGHTAPRCRTIRAKRRTSRVPAPG